MISLTSLTVVYQLSNNYEKTKNIHGIRDCSANIEFAHEKCAIVEV